MLEVVVFVGLQASGKTTCYRCGLAATHDHISKDNWPNARRRQRRQLRLLDEALADGRSVVVDNTNPTSEDRVVSRSGPTRRPPSVSRLRAKASLR